jgi:precorrin-6Y C5,15-methyltransferase (decarboxylating)
LPAPTHVFVGGSGGRLGDILDRVKRWGGGIRVVINAVTLKTAVIAEENLKSGDFTDFELIEVQINRQNDKPPILRGGNPIYIISATTV